MLRVQLLLSLSLLLTNNINIMTRYKRNKYNSVLVHIVIRAEQCENRTRKTLFDELVNTFFFFFFTISRSDYFGAVTFAGRKNRRR